jgi:tetratricopeptide (TPR) repeat protein
LAEFVERDPDVAGSFRFRHALIRDAAYEGLSFKRRRKLHGRVAEAIERQNAEKADDVAELLSLHYFTAGRWDEAWTYSRLAGDLARDVYANVDAARFYERAIQASTELGELPDAEVAAAWTALGEVRDAAGNYSGAVAALAEAARLLRARPVEAAAVYETRATAWTRLSEYENALADTDTGLALIEGIAGEDARRARNDLLAIQAQIHLQRGHPLEAIEIAQKVVDDAEALGPTHALARAYSALDGGYFDLGEPEKAVHEVKALAIYRELGAARRAAVIESNLGVTAYAEGRWADASAYYARSKEELERLGDSTQAAFAGANLGEVLVSRGLLTEAESTLEDARRTLRAAEHVTGSIFAETQLARLALVRGDVDSAIDDLTRVVDEAVSVGSAPYALEAWIYLAEAHTQRGAAERALEALAAAEKTLGRESSPLAARLARVRAVALELTGDSTGALEQAELAIAVARRQRLLYEEEQALRVLAEFLTARGDGARAREALDEAERLAERLAASS